MIYLALALVLVAIGGVIFYLFVKPAPSCTDGKMNQDELGVDCGGSCPQVCPVEIQPLRVAWKRIFKVDEGRYDIAALVKNPNLRHGIQSVNYTFKIWDAENILLNVETGRAFVNPKEDLLVYLNRIEVGKRIPARVDFELEAPIWQKVDRETPRLSFSGKKFVNEPTPRLSAVIRNDTPATIRELTVLALLSDGEQNALAMSSTYLPELPAGESREIVFTWPKPFVDAVAFVDLAAHFDWKQLPP